MEYALAASSARSASVIKALIRLGVEQGRMISTAYGMERPLCTSGTPLCRGRNRRAEVKWFGRKPT